MLSVPVSKKDVNKQFDNILLKVIDDSFTHIGHSFSSVVYFYMERDFIKKQEVPASTEQFSACLKKLFGEQAQFIIEMVIVRKLYTETEQVLKEKEKNTFTDYVDSARTKYMKKIKESLQNNKNQNSDLR